MGHSIILILILIQAGQEIFKKLLLTFNKESPSVFIVYDVQNMESFENISKWVTEIKENAYFDLKTYVIGNKIEEEEKREVD